LLIRVELFLVFFEPGSGRRPRNFPRGLTEELCSVVGTQVDYPHLPIPISRLQLVELSSHAAEVVLYLESTLLVPYPEVARDRNLRPLRSLPIEVLGMK
jgi:hypothetical protein